MFLRANRRKKNDKVHRYFSVVENRRLGHRETPIGDRDTGAAPSLAAQAGMSGDACLAGKAS